MVNSSFKTALQVGDDMFETKCPKAKMANTSSKTALQGGDEMFDDNKTFDSSSSNPRESSDKVPETKTVR